MAYSKKIIDALNGKKTSSDKPQRRQQREASLQIQCVRWFQLQFPAFARLLYHPKNEAVASSRRVAIDAAAGVVPGVPDLILALPAIFPESSNPCGDVITASSFSMSLGIELKYGHTNNQSPAQREFQAYYEAAQHRYALVRSIDEFINVVRDYMAHIPPDIRANVSKLYHSDTVATDANKNILKRITNK